MTSEIANSFSKVNVLIEQLEVCLGYNSGNTNVTCNNGISSSDLYQDLKFTMDVQATR